MISTLACLVELLSSLDRELGVNVPSCSVLGRLLPLKLPAILPNSKRHTSRDWENVKEEIKSYWFHAVHSHRPGTERKGNPGGACNSIELSVAGLEITRPEISASLWHPLRGRGDCTVFSKYFPASSGF